MLSKILLFAQGQETSWDVSYAVPTTDDLYIVGFGSNAGEEGITGGTSQSFQSSSVFSLASTGDFRIAMDGTKLITTNEDTISSYSLNPSYSFAYDDYAQVGTSLDVSAVESVVTGIYVKDDGFKMYIVGTDYDAVHEYVMTTAWDVSTASLNHSYDYTAESTPEAVQAKKILFRPDGKRFWLTKSDATDVFEFDLTDAWDLSTASFNLRHFEANTGTEDAFDFSPDGRYVISTYGTAQRVQKLSVPYDLGSDYTLLGNFSLGTQLGTSSLQVVQNGASIAIDSGTTPRFLVIGSFGKRITNTGGDTRYSDIRWNGDGTKLYYRQGSSLFSYDFTTGYDLYSLDTSSTNIATPNTEVEFTTTRLSASWDYAVGGTKLYTVYRTTNTLNIYGWNLSSAYDFSSASQDGSSYLSVTSYHDDTDTAISVSRDGTKLYVLGYNAAGTDIIISQYDIDPDGSVADGTYDGALTITDDGEPDESKLLGLLAMYWKHDGTRLFIPRYENKQVSGVSTTLQPHILEYRLTSPWDITSATFHQYQPVRTGSSTTTGLTFHPEGLRLWLSTNFQITEYSLEDT